MINKLLLKGGHAHKRGVNGDDDREPVLNREYPYDCIVKIDIGGQWGCGTGFFISDRCIITAAHVLCPSHMKRLPEKASVSLLDAGGRKIKTINSKLLLSYPNEWKDNKYSRRYDFAAIILPPHEAYKPKAGFFGYKVCLDGVIDNIEVAGYPTDKRPNTMYTHKGPATTHSHYLHYKVDTKGGQSGSPVFTKEGGRYVVIGVHSCDAGEKNQATRVDKLMMDKFKIWTKKDYYEKACSNKSNLDGNDL